jgi:hypothetical protein
VKRADGAALSFRLSCFTEFAADITGISNCENLSPPNGRRKMVLSPRIGLIEAP